MSQSILERMPIIGSLGNNPRNPIIMKPADHDELPTAGREPAICELICLNCGDGLRFDDQQCSTCGERNLRYRA